MTKPLRAATIRNPNLKIATAETVEIETVSSGLGQMHTQLKLGVNERADPVGSARIDLASGLFDRAVKAVHEIGCIRVGQIK